MKKQSLSLFMLFSLALSIPGPAHALSLKEQARKFKQKAIELAKKGGAQSKKLWDKINFMGNAQKEYGVAQTLLEECQMKRCKSEKETYTKSPTDYSVIVLNDCSKRECVNELKELKQASNKLAGRLMALIAATQIAIFGVVLGSFELSTQEARRKAAERKEETMKELEEAREEFKELKDPEEKEWQVSPYYE